MYLVTLGSKSLLRTFSVGETTRPAYLRGPNLAPFLFQSKNMSKDEMVRLLRFIKNGKDLTEAEKSEFVATATKSILEKINPFFSDT